MKIVLNNNDKSVLEQYFLQQENNIFASEQDSLFLNEHYDDISSEDLKPCLANGMNEEDGMKSLFLSILDEEENGLEEALSSCLFGKIDHLHDKDYSDNPYFKYVKLKDFKDGKYSIETNYYAPYECFVYDQTKQGNEKYAEVTPIGYFRKKFPYYVMNENNVVWMSITPYEINTMKDALDRCHGNVMTFGLGLGYYAFMASMKDDVKSVTIIENSKSVISLFEKHILPFFPHKEKIRIVKGDAFISMKKADEFDTIFIDIYHSAEDALPLYIKFKCIEKKCGIKTEVDYWIEDSILTYFRRFVLAFLYENYYGETKEEDYLNDSTEEDRIMKKIYLSLKDRDFASIDEIDNLLSEKGLKELISSF